MRFAIQPRPKPERRRGTAALGALLLLLPFLAAPELGAAPARGTPDDSLAASWQAPWNPESAMPRRRGWERAALFPGRLVSLPLSGLGYVMQASLAWLEDGDRLPIGAEPGRARPPRAISLGLPRLGDRTGLGASVMARTELPRPLESTLAVDYAASVKLYNRTRVTWSGRPLALEYGYEWRPEERFYGLGAASARDSVSDYALQQEWLKASAGWTWGSDPDPDRPQMAVRAWAGPRSAVTRNGRETGKFSYHQLFPALAPTLDDRVEHMVYGASWLADQRAGAPHWSRGYRLLASAERYAQPGRALALHSPAGDGAAFTRYRIEAETGFSFGRDPRTVRIAGFLTDQQITARAERFLPGDLATLGGRPGLGGFQPGRFHDLDMVLTRVTYVFPLLRRLEVDLHAEWGATYPDVWSDATLASLHSSFGFRLRGRSDHEPRGAIGLDISREDIRLRYTLGGVE